MAAKTSDVWVRTSWTSVVLGGVVVEVPEDHEVAESQWSQAAEVAEPELS